MKKKYFISKTVMFVLISVILAGQTQIQTYAQNTTQQADAAYRNILKKALNDTERYYYPEFAQADVDGDGHKEVMLVYCGDVSGSAACYEGLFLNYEGGKLVKSKFWGYGGSYCNGYIISGYAGAAGGMGTDYYEITKKGSLKLRASELSDFTGDNYKVNNKSTTRKDFKKYISNKKLNKNQKDIHYKTLTRSELDKAFPVKISTNAKSAKAKTAFKKYIKNKSYKSDGDAGDILNEYAFVDLNKDGTTEMIIREEGIVDYAYAYINEKVKFLGQMYHSAYPSGRYCAEKGYIVENCYNHTAYYCYNGKSLRLKAEYDYGTYRVDGKKTTAKKFAAVSKALTDNVTYKEISDLNWISL